ncbi:MAG: ABC transporter substrate-binding protein [candidate division NC10 bacterium]|nr:ABC transporter substrate-binding protein [candidate division NC10 bacterium]
MFYALAKGKLDVDDLQFEHVIRDIETLNRWAFEGKLEVTALSLHAYSHVSDKYALLPHGASMGSRYGPIVVARELFTVETLRAKRIAVPGLLTTAFLTLKIAIGEFPFVEVPFDQILDVVAKGEADAGLLIHEGQLTYEQYGLTKVLDLGEWWHQETGLPLPLGVNVIRKDLAPAVARQISSLLRESIHYALDHREEALDYAMQFARGMERRLADRFVGMYVNRYTIEYGSEGRRAIERLFQMGIERGALKSHGQVEFFEG